MAKLDEDMAGDMATEKLPLELMVKILHYVEAEEKAPSVSPGPGPGPGRRGWPTRRAALLPLRSVSRGWRDAADVALSALECYVPAPESDETHAGGSPALHRLTADLQRWPQIRRLHLAYGGGRSAQHLHNCLAVLGCLAPRLTELRLTCVLGAADMGVLGELGCLETLEVKWLDAPAWESLALTLPRLPRLSTLALWRFGRNFPALAGLRSAFLCNYYGLPSASGGLSGGIHTGCALLGEANLGPGLSRCCALTSLCIQWCDLLNSDLTLPPSHGLRVLRLVHIENMANLHGLKNLAQLEVLELDDCWDVSSLADLEHLGNLKSVRLARLPLAEPPSLAASASCLCDLALSELDELPKLPELENLTALQRLMVHSCGAVRQLPSLVGCISLCKLTVTGCGLLSHIPDLSGLPALCDVDVSDCDELLGAAAMASCMWPGLLRLLHDCGCRSWHSVRHTYSPIGSQLGQSSHMGD